MSARRRPRPGRRRGRCRPVLVISSASSRTDLTRRAGLRLEPHRRGACDRRLTAGKALGDTGVPGDEAQPVVRILDRDRYGIADFARAVVDAGLSGMRRLLSSSGVAVQFRRPFGSDSIEEVLLKAYARFPRPAVDGCEASPP